MSPEDLLRAGKPDEAIAELQRQIRGNPGDARLRIFLFQLLAVQGQWDRALTQLQVMAELDAGTLMMVQTYREAIACEALRREVFAGNRSPLIFGEPTEWLALQLEALRLTAQGHHAQGQDLRAKAFETAAAVPGRIILLDADSDGTPFEWLADADPRLGPVLEAIVNGRYYWVPLERIQSIEIDPPSDLRDAVWMPARFRWVNAGEAVGLIPTRYPGSEASDDPLVRLSRKTEWTEPLSGLFLGRGQRILATDADECPLMDVRRIAFGPMAE